MPATTTTMITTTNVNEIFGRTHLVLWKRVSQEAFSGLGNEMAVHRFNGHCGQAKLVRER